MQGYLFSAPKSADEIRELFLPVTEGPGEEPKQALAS